MKFCRFNSLVTASLIAATCLFTSCQKQTSEQPQPVTSKYELNFVPAKTANELRLLQQDPKANLVRTQADFDALLATGHSPLAKLSPSVQKAFKSNIVFRQNVGVVGFKYNDIRSLLSEDEFAEVLASFGLDTKNGYWGFSTNPKIVGQLSGRTSGDIQLEQPADEDLKEGYICIPQTQTCEKRAGFLCLNC